MKKTVLLTAVTASVLVSSSAFAAGGISVTLNGREIEFDAQPQIINDTVMVPMRKMFEAIDADIQWDGEASAAAAVKEARYARFTNGSDTFELGVCEGGTNDGERISHSNVKLDSEPVIIDDTMYIPMRALAESFNYTVEWDEAENTAKISTPDDADGWIYYSSWSDGGHMYKTDTNGQHRQLISDDDCYSESGTFDYANGYIFYSIRNHEHPEEEGCLYRIKTDGTGKEKLTEMPVRKIYSRKKTLNENKDYICYLEEKKNSEGEPIYSSDEQRHIISLNTKTGEATRLIDEPVDSVSIYGDYIYFKYASDKIDKAFTFYRADLNGENIINVTGDIATGNYQLGFEEESDRITFRPYKGNYYYSAALDGSDLKKEDYPSYSSPYYKSANQYGLDYIKHRGDGFVIGTKKNDEDKYYVIDEDGNELSILNITIPEGYDGIEFESIEDKIYYIFYEEPEQEKKIYVSDIDELLGMKYISVGGEKVDDKYEITVSSYLNPSSILPLRAQTRIVDIDGSNDRLFLEDCGVEAYNDGGAYRLRVINMQDGSVYTCDPDGDNMEYQGDFGTIIDNEMSYTYDSYVDADHNEELRTYEREKPQGVLKENVHYGIVVNNDGTTKAYEYNKIW